MKTTIWTAVALLALLDYCYLNPNNIVSWQSGLFVIALLAIPRLTKVLHKWAGIEEEANEDKHNN